MLRKLYRATIAPRQQDPNLRSREVVLNVLLCATLFIMSIALLLQIIVFGMQQIVYMPTRIIGMGSAIAIVGGLYYLSRTGRYMLAAYGLVVIYFALTALIMYTWGTRLPVGMLLCSLLIVMSGILLGVRNSVYVALLVVAVFFVLRYTEQSGITIPYQGWIYEPASVSGGAGVLLLFIILATVSWLFNYQMERSLRRAHQAELALIHQKEQLEIQVEERTRQLQAAQLEKMQQLYRFAELGQLSMGLLHELANHLTTLTLDIESLESQNRSHLLTRAKGTMRYIDDLVHRVRDQLHGKSEVASFNAVAEIAAVVKILHHKASNADVIIDWQSPTNRSAYRCQGDPIRFRQLLANVVSNAIDAAQAASSSSPKRVAVELSHKDSQLSISVKDWGKGIKQGDCSKIFEPFYGHKKTGMGMGLFITKQLTEEYFGGNISATSNGCTEFKVTIPQKAPHDPSYSTKH